METIAKLWPLWTALGVMNLVTFIVYAYDKHIAKQNRGKRRVPERTLILVPLSLILWACGLGALIAHLLGAF